MAFTYKGLQAQYSRHLVTDEEVDRNVERLLQQNPRIAEVTDRPTQDGDEIVLNYAGYCDGVQFPGGTAENQTLVLGSGMFIPGFEEQLLDKVPGQEVTVTVTFPKEYHAEELAGKEATFECKILSVRVKSAYDPDNTFAKEVGGCETFDEMKEKMKQSLQAYSDERGEMDLQDRLLDMAAETLEFTVTEQMKKEAVDDQIYNLRQQLSQQGLTLEMYCQFMSTTEEQIRKDVEATAVAALKAKATIDEIVMIEGLKAEEEDIAKAMAVVCRHNNITMDELKEQYDSALEQLIINSVLTGKVMRLIRDAAVVTEV